MRQRSLWTETAVAPRRFGSLTEQIDVEVAIVGGGLAGLSCALALAEQGVSVALLEAFSVGHGASGSSGGQVIPGIRHLPDELLSHYGQEVGKRIHDFGCSAADATFALIDSYGLECDALRDGWINVTDAQAGLRDVRERVSAWNKRGAAAHELSKGDIQDLLGTKAYVGGWIHPGGGGIHPLSLVRELARVAAEKGALIYENSPVYAMKKKQERWQLQTDKGSITASRILIATNGRSPGLTPELARSVIPVWSFQIATPAGTSPMKTRAVVSDNRRVLRYFRPDAHGRVIVGGKGTATGPKGLASFNFQRQTLGRIYPELAGITPEFYWGGQVSVTLGRLPKLLVIDDGVFATQGCNGKGVAWNVALGPVLADVLRGVDPEKLPLPQIKPVQPIPLYPLRRIYAAMGSSWLRLRDSLDSL